MWKDKNSGFRIRWCHSWYMLCIVCKGCYRVCITCASSYSINKWKIGLPRSVLSSTIEMFKMFKTQVEPRAAGEWFHFKVTWKIAVNLFFTISLLSDNFDIHQRLDNACKKEKNKLRRHHIIVMICSTGSRPWDGEGGGGRSSRPIDKGEGRSPQKHFSPFESQFGPKMKGGPGFRALPLDQPLVCTLIEHSAREIARSYWKNWVECGK